MTKESSSGKQKKFDDILTKLTFGYKGYQLEKMASPFLSALVYYNIPRRRLCFIALAKFLSIRSMRRFPQVNTGVLFSFPEWTNRKDYIEICDYVMSQVNDKFFFRLSALRRRFAFNPRHLWLAIRKCRELPGLNFMGKMYMTAAVYNGLLMIDEAEKELNVVAQKYVSFSCVTGLEHLLTQYFRKRSIPTYSLQHGITFLYNKNLQDALDYTNLVSEHPLVWGDYTRNELMKYGLNGREILVAGYPRKHDLLPIDKPLTHDCVVFLSRQYFNKENLRLLSILQASVQGSPVKIRFHLKLHPSLNTQDYRKWVNDNGGDGSISLLPTSMTLQEILKSIPVGFCVVVNSSTYYECYMHGRVALRYCSDSFDEEHAIANDLFSSTEEFIRLLHTLYESFEEHFRPDSIRRELQYVLGQGNEYGNILNG